MSLDDLLLEDSASVVKKNDEQISLEDLMKINLHHQKAGLLLMSGLLFMMISILNFPYVTALKSAAISIQYMLYRYMVVGEYANAPVDYTELMIPSILAGAVGLALFLCYIVKTRKRGG
ncbi:MAG: hypothetical protein HDT19_01305 [Oscillibacter sp.]|nr:hypothetical protein [Oscillibacter sp.]